MPLSSITNKTQDAAGTSRCTDWHTLLLGGQSSFNNHKRTPATVAAYDDLQQQRAGARGYARLQEQLAQPTVNAKQHQNTQHPASFDLMFLQGGVPRK
jgi:hypothetical protein